MVSRIRNYKMVFGTITRAIGKIIGLPIEVGNINYNMVFLIVDIETTVICCWV
jgi:hypothetical protein